MNAWIRLVWRRAVVATVAVLVAVALIVVAVRRADGPDLTAVATSTGTAPATIPATPSTATPASSATTARIAPETTTRPSAPATSTTSTTVPGADSCVVVWSVTAPTPTVPCRQPDGSPYLGRRLVCTDGTVLWIGRPDVNGPGPFTGKEGDRLTATTPDGAIEAAAACAPPEGGT